MPFLKIWFHPKTGINHMEAPIQAMVIITNARFFVRFLKYLNGEVIDQ